MIEFFTYDFMQKALLAGLLSSILCGIVGPFVVTKRLVFLSEGMSHISFGGLGLAYYFETEYLFPGALLFSCIAALLLARFHDAASLRKDSFIGLLCALGISLGTLCMYYRGGYSPDLMLYLFGTLLNVSAGDICLMSGVLALVLAVLLLFFRELVILAFDPDLLRLKGLSVFAFHAVFYVMIAVTVTVLLKLVGTMLATTLLALPVNVAALYCQSMKSLICASVAVNAVCVALGLILSYLLDVPSGPAIFLVCCGCFFVGKFFQYFYISQTSRKLFG